MGWLVGEDDMIKGTPDGEEGMVGWLGIGQGGGYHKNNYTLVTSTSSATPIHIYIIYG